MCGICGYTGDEVPGLLRSMCAAIEHRGPDAEGHLQRPGVHLGNRRLRVLDLEGGDQPIFSEDGQVGVVYNGEIYNYRELRAELIQKGHTFRTDSDTEVLVHLYEEYGADCPKYLNGMFAFAIYDERNQRLFLARDPIGIKPLVYYWTGSELIFGSEIKSLLKHPAVSAELDPDSLHVLLNVRFIPSPRTLFRGVEQLPPGYSLTVENNRLKTARYHNWEFGHRSPCTPHEAGEEFSRLLSASVQRQKVSDVPLGVYLSGGIDSSSVLAGAVEGGKEPVRTFALGFGEPTDELSDARRVADHFKTDHHDTVLAPNPLSLYPRIIYHTEVPKVNAPQGYYLAQFARSQVSVALSGLGGDELFLGYDIYNYLWPGAALIENRPLSFAASLGAPIADGLAGAIDTMIGPTGENGRRMAELLACGRDPLRYYLTLRNGWDLRAGAEHKIYTTEWQRQLSMTTRDAFLPYFDRPDLPFVEQVQWAEFRAKMVDDFLLNEDRMSMAHSLEVRVPLLDLEMVRFALSLPLHVKREGGVRKAVMKRGLRNRLPARVLSKKKWGFSVNPYHQFQKDLRTLCERELTPSFVREQGIFNDNLIRTILSHKPSRWMRWHYFTIWQMLGLKFWQEIFVDGRDWHAIEERISATTR